MIHPLSTLQYTEGIDFTDASNDEIAEAICQLHSLQVSVQARLFEAVRVFAARSGYVGDGSRSMTDGLVCSLGVSVSTARRLSETALALGQLPALEEVFSRGEVSFDQLRPVAAVATRDSDEELAQMLPGLSAARAESLARGLRPLSSEEEHESHRRRRLHLTHRGEMVRISGQLAAAGGELVSRALGRIAETYGPDEATGTYEPYESRLADALTQLCSTSVAADAEPDKATVVVHFGKEVLQGEEGPVFTGDGLHLSPETARRLSCDCRYQVSIDDEFGQAIGLGRMTRSFPAWLNRQLRRRDGGCRFPGCRARRLVQGHHIVFWGMGGRTDPANTLLLNVVATIASFTRRIARYAVTRTQRSPLSHREARWSPPARCRSAKTCTRASSAPVPDRPSSRRPLRRCIDEASNARRSVGVAERRRDAGVVAHGHDPRPPGAVALAVNACRTDW